MITDKLIHGDAYVEIKKIESNSVDLIITDPPYEISGSTTRKGNNKITNSCSKLVQELKDAEIVNGINYDILEEFVRVMKKINIYIFCNRKQIIPYLDFFVKKHGCNYEILLWIKTNPVPAFENNYLPDKEYCLYFRKGVKLHTTYDRAKTYWITPTNMKDKRKYNHPTIKPVEIIEKLVLNSSAENDIILDPFCGSGTTCVVAKKWNRRYIGIEKNHQYYLTSKNRINENM